MALLTRLNGCPFVPRLLAVDRKNGEIFMTDCGETIDELPYWQAQLLKRRVPRLMQHLEKNYGITLFSRDGKRQKYTIPLRNLTIKQGKVFIIDFNGAGFRLDGQPIHHQTNQTNTPTTHITTQHLENSLIR
jgi:hypothetical protein